MRSKKYINKLIFWFIDVENLVGRNKRDKYTKQGQL